MNKPVDFPLTSFNDEDSNSSANPTFEQVLSARLSRRGLLRGGLGGTATLMFGTLGTMSLAACGGGDDEPNTRVERLGFNPVAKSIADVLSVPAGYTATVLYALGDPLTAATPTFKNDGTDTDYDNRAGDHHDGMEYFGLSADGTRRDPYGVERGLLGMNHEALTDHFLHPNGSTVRPRPAAESDKEIPAHGVSIVEVRKTGSAFAYTRDSTYNRRVTPLTPLELSGVARGSAQMVTRYSAAGTTARGTINNCGTGYTPWGTLLTGEENWAGYLTRSATDNTTRGGATAKSVVSLNRYGRAQGAASRHGWETSGVADKYARWNITQTPGSANAADDYRNELNTFGYMVEIDPYDKAATIKKRTGLGRFAHESAAFGKPVEGKPLAVYMGDDSRGEYIYKWVSTALWSAADANAANRMAVGDKYLDAGKLYVAKFSADGTGVWVEMAVASIPATYTAYAFADAADVAINTRLAGDAVGATKMDRPEWCATQPISGEVYFTLTNNSNRKVEPSGAGQQGIDAANPRAYSDSFGGAAAGSPGNVNGHILRLAENGSEPAATAFRWDVYLFGAEAGADAGKINLSSLTADQDFSSPDGLWFSPTTGVGWIQTDDGSYVDVTNCMMLAAVPGTVGDGAKKTLAYTKADGSTLNVDTYVGKTPTADTLKRFLVGPADCEITGCTETPDGRALFVNIQHPGESITAANVVNPATYLSHWPGNAGYGAGGANARPRSATVVITKNDGGLIGS